MNAIGVDAGGTRTVAALSSEGVFVREGRGPAANATTVGIDDAADAILQSIRAAAHGIKPDTIYGGAAGAGRPEVASALERLIASAHAPARIVVADDTAIALRSRIPQGPGIVLIAGTGSVAYAENGETRVRTGGLGYLLGDEGSAFAIGLAAVKLYGRVLDGRTPRDETSDLVARAVGAADRPALLAAIYDARFNPATIANFAPSIIGFAGKGNRAATKIVQEASRELGDLIKTTAKLAGLADASPVVALAGGLMRENSLLTFLLETRINGDFAGAAIVRGGDEPVRGALRLAEALAAHA
ncbi:MAG: BadF/BadG/BcrA/BcrD ATPase family protein [Candidatus Velthaea sp.]